MDKMKRYEELQNEVEETGLVLPVKERADKIMAITDNALDEEESALIKALLDDIKTICKINEINRCVELVDEFMQKLP